MIAIAVTAHFFSGTRTRGPLSSFHQIERNLFGDLRFASGEIGQASIGCLAWLVSSALSITGAGVRKVSHADGTQSRGVGPVALLATWRESNHAQAG